MSQPEPQQKSTAFPWLLAPSSDKTFLVLGALEEWPHQKPDIPGLHTPRRRQIARVFGDDDEGKENARLIQIAPRIQEVILSIEGVIVELEAWDSVSAADEKHPIGYAVERLRSTIIILEGKEIEQ